METQIGRANSELKSVDLATFLRCPPPKWLIAGLLQSGGLSVLYGLPGSGKTFLAVDIACAVATGRQWNERSTVGGAVLYVATEDPSGVAVRLRAYCEEYSLLEEEVDLRAWRNGLNLLEDKSVESLIDEVKSIEHLKLVVVDTFAQSMPGDENSSQNMGQAIRSLQRIRSAADCSLLVIHHAGKDTSRGMRGWSGLEGATDTVICLSDRSGIIEAKVERHRNWSAGEKIQFRLRVRPIKMGDVGTLSCVLDYLDIQALEGPPLGDLQMRLIEAHTRLSEMGQDPITDQMIVQELRSTGTTSYRLDNINRSIRSLRDRGVLPTVEEFPSSPPPL